jgi:type IV secretory pathway TrbD component
VKTEELKTPIHESLNRPILLLGGERNLVLMLAVIAGVFILSLAKLWAALAGLVLWTVGQWTLSRAASYDALLSKTGPRSLRYRRFYSAQATPFGRLRDIQ